MSGVEKYGRLEYTGGVDDDKYYEQTMKAEFSGKGRSTRLTITVTNQRYQSYLEIGAGPEKKHPLFKDQYEISLSDLDLEEGRSHAHEDGDLILITKGSTKTMKHRDREGNALRCDRVRLRLDEDGIAERLLNALKHSAKLTVTPDPF